jgi:hypothetical protein
METTEDRVRDALLRIAEAEQPIPAAELYRRASRETHTLTPFALHGLDRLVESGELERDDAGIITVRLDDPDKQRCERCADEVYTLSSRFWCDGCEEEASG